MSTNNLTRQSSVYTLSSGSSLASPPVTIRVGKAPHTKDFFAHKDVICRRSPFFAAALNGTWIEATTGIVNLPEDSPDTFLRYLNVLYTNDAFTGIVDDIMSPKKPEDPEEIKRIMDRITTALAETYVLAEKLHDTVSKNAIVTSLYDMVENWSKLTGVAYTPAGNAIKTVYGGTMAGNPVRRLLAHSCNRIPHSDYLIWKDQNFDAISTEFFRDVMDDIRSSESKLDSFLEKVEDPSDVRGRTG